MDRAGYVIVQIGLIDLLLIEISPQSSITVVIYLLWGGLIEGYIRGICPFGSAGSSGQEE